MKKLLSILAVTACVGISAPLAAMASPDGAEIYVKRCKMCHDLEKKKMAPAVKAMNPDTEIMRNMILNGKKMMPKFAEKLSAEEVDAVIVYMQAHIEESADKK